MASISYRPSDDVLSGVAAFAKEAGFRKFRTRFRLGVEGGHGLVLLGEDGSVYKGRRQAHWHLYVCHRTWADVYQEAWNRPLVVDPLKFDPDPHAVARFSLVGRKKGEHPSYRPDNPKDVEGYIRHVDDWFTNTALPMALEWLRSPSLMVEQFNVQLPFYLRHPDTDITMGNGGHLAPIAVVLAADAGDHDRVRKEFASVLQAAESNPARFLRWVKPLEAVLTRAGVATRT
jgi:hypothetical protein